MAYLRGRGFAYPDNNVQFQMIEVTLSGTNPTVAVMTNLAIVTWAVVADVASSTPGLESAATVSITGVDNNVSIYAWACTSSSNPTLIASTSTTRKVIVLAMGQAAQFQT